MSDNSIEKGVVSNDDLVNEHGYLIDQLVDFECGVPESLSVAAWFVVVLNFANVSISMDHPLWVYIDSRANTERVYRYFYWAINFGALVGQALTPALSKDVRYKLYTIKKPSGSVFAKGLKDAEWDDNFDD
ncbi:hypothetical protein BB559_005272 [Furculomyces boomerangus]|uniref:Uncharacterized protein n=1 Tax=Furculomyces boomerangus TaxID=61424 RepID=A0A2T9XXT8_9FUNG|nr:hypothetical protein BB559_007305 [Furculomyces boomerangus]PVU89008.1 hypothetical protein BB559_005272 [Furculomyces boomerangus]